MQQGVRGEGRATKLDAAFLSLYQKTPRHVYDRHETMTRAERQELLLQGRNARSRNLTPILAKVSLLNSSFSALDPNFKPHPRQVSLARAHVCTVDASRDMEPFSLMCTQVNEEDEEEEEANRMPYYAGFRRSLMQVLSVIFRWLSPWFSLVVAKVIDTQTHETTAAG